MATLSLSKQRYVLDAVDVEAVNKICLGLREVDLRERAIWYQEECT